MEKTTLPDCGFTREGYKFAGWNTEADGTGTPYGDVNNTKDIPYTFRKGETTLHAQWAEPVTVSFDPNDGEGTMEFDFRVMIRRNMNLICPNALLCVKG